jgi:putative proteasome-type protease
MVRRWSRFARDSGLGYRLGLLMSKEGPPVTYCVGLFLKDGLVMLADTRTNAGVDNISTFGKLHVFHRPGERLIAVMTAGNLAISQSVVNQIQEGVESETGDIETIYSVPSMFRAAELVGRTIRKVWKTDGEALEAQNVRFDANILVGGQLKGRQMRLFQVYAAGNFIAATQDTPYLQVGEHKYGKPILDRAAAYDTALTDGIKLTLVSMDSTLRSNLSVGLPADLMVYKRDSLEVAVRRRITDDDPYFRMIRERWSTSLREAYRAIPSPDWGV